MLPRFPYISELRGWFWSFLSKESMQVPFSIFGLLTWRWPLRVPLALGISIFFLVFSAFSNAATQYIQVDDLDANTHNGESLIFKGGDAYKVLQILPQDSIYSGSRRLTVTSKDRSFTISCMAKSKQIGDRTFKIDPSSTECRIVIDKSFKPANELETPKVWNPGISQN